MSIFFLNNILRVYYLTNSEIVSVFLYPLGSPGVRNNMNKAYMSDHNALYQNTRARTLVISFDKFVIFLDPQPATNISCLKMCLYIGLLGKGIIEGRSSNVVNSFNKLTKPGKFASGSN